MIIISFFLQTTFTFDVRRKYFKETLDRLLHLNYNVVKSYLILNLKLHCIFLK